MTLTRPLLKICGLRDPDQAAAVAALGADAIGVIAVVGSPRFVAPGARPELFAAVHRAAPACLGVLVVANPPNSALPELGPGQGHQVVQLHGDESPQRCAELRHWLPHSSLWKALRIRSRDDLQRVDAYRGVVDAILLDAWAASQLGGTGQRLPLDWLADFDPGLPWWLAGGITPETAPEALEMLRPHGLDASSGVEHSPGHKDLDRVAALIATLPTA